MNSSLIKIDGITTGDKYLEISERHGGTIEIRLTVFDSSDDISSLETVNVSVLGVDYIGRITDAQITRHTPYGLDGAATKSYQSYQYDIVLFKE